jgi:hypothetical protein
MSCSASGEYHNKHARLYKWMAKGFKHFSILVGQILLSNLHHYYYKMHQFILS